MVNSTQLTRTRPDNYQFFSQFRTLSYINSCKLVFLVGGFRLSKVFTFPCVSTLRPPTRSLCSCLRFQPRFLREGYPSSLHTNESRVLRLQPVVSLTLRLRHLVNEGCVTSEKRYLIPFDIETFSVLTSKTF